MGESIDRKFEDPHEGAKSPVDDATFREATRRFGRGALPDAGTSINEDDGNRGGDRHLEKKSTLDDRIREAAVREATSMHARAVEAEPIVTKDLDGVARDAGCRLGGLENRLKTRSSLEEKLTCDPFVGSQAKRPEAVIASRGDLVNDALRYTVISTEDRYLAARSDVHDALGKRGYQMERFSNAWVPPDGSVAEPYRGINETWRTPQGYPFEIQFHTAASFDMKNSNHALYEEWRKQATEELRGSELAGIMSGRFDSVPVPLGALDGPRTSGSTRRATSSRGDDSAEGMTK